MNVPNFQYSDNSLEQENAENPQPSYYFKYSVLFLFFQLILILIGKYIWPILEGSHVERVTSGLRGETISKEEIVVAASDLNGFKNRKTFYFSKYLISNFLTIAVVAGQIAMHLYLFGCFSDSNNSGFSLGKLIKWVREDVDTRDDQLIKLFPRRISCDVKQYGPTGSMNSREFVCYSSYNGDNEFVHFFSFFFLLCHFAALVLNTLYTVVSVNRLIVVRLFVEEETLERSVAGIDASQKLLLILVRKNVGPRVTNAILLEMANNNNFANQQIC